MGMVGVSPVHSDSIARSRVLGIAIYGNLFNEVHVLHGVKTKVVARAARVIIPPLLIMVAIIFGCAI
jgi:hypothetical protein